MTNKTALPFSELVLASNNKGKLAELQAMLGDSITVRPQSDFTDIEAEETGLTFVENALIKARHAARISGLPALADDSGLAVDALGGAPGIYSARYAGGGGDAANNAKLLEALKDVPDAERGAQFICALALLRHYRCDMVQGYLNGDEDLKEMEKAESKYLMKAKAEDVTEDWRIQNVWNGTMETYQEYQRLKDVDKAKANAFKNSKTNKRLFAVRKAISAAKRKMNKAKKQMDGTNDAAKLVEIRNTRKELLKTLNGME